MKLTLAKHKQYCSITYTEDELTKIVSYADKTFMQYYKEWQNNNRLDKNNEDELVWFILVDQFVKLPEGKKTKAFFYQMLVLNGIAIDGINDKSICQYRNNKSCPILSRWKEKLGHSLLSEEEENICSNLAICLRPAEPSWIILDQFPAEQTEVELDDRILKLYRRQLDVNMGKRIKPQEYVIYLSKDSGSEVCWNEKHKEWRTYKKKPEKQKRMSSKQVREMIKRKEKRYE